MPHVEIRKAVPEDAARVAAIARAAYAKYVPRIGDEPPPMRADFAGEIAAGRVVVVGPPGAVWGYMIAWPEPQAYLIDNLAVEPERQGEGFGRALIEHACAQAKHHGLRAARLYTHVTMTENQALYARLGFVETHRAVEQGRHRVHMRRALLPD